jgi:putative transposase
VARMTLGEQRCKALELLAPPPSRITPTAASRAGRGSASSKLVGVADIRISMDGRGRWMDNVFIERQWRSLKYECVYLNAFETGSEARTGIGRWVAYYNADRPHSVFAGRTPDEVYATQANEEEICGVIQPSLSQAAILSRQAGPPHRPTGLEAAMQFCIARPISLRSPVIPTKPQLKAVPHAILPDRKCHVV